MRLTHVELRRARLPLVAPFRTSFGIETARDVLFVRVMGPDAEGWGECVAMEEPLYSSEYVDGAHALIRRFLLARLGRPSMSGSGKAGAIDITAEDVADRLAPVRGHPMAKAAIEAAVLDAETRCAGRSLADRLGAVHDRVPAGVSVGIQTSIPALLDTVEGYLDEGYLRIKLKIEPGADIDQVRAVRERFGPDVLLQVDANAAYRLADAEHLARLDPFDLLLIEQPLPEDDVPGHAELARRIATPVCLDESLTSARGTAEAIGMGACAIVNIKPGRVGGFLEAVRIHDVCVGAGVPVWCGGMLETGIGRAANVALAALPGFTLPGDTSASNRYFHRDVTEPFVLDHGHLRVPSGPGIGVVPRMDILDELTTSVETIRLAELH